MPLRHHDCYTGPRSHYLGPVSKSTYGNTASIEYAYNNDLRYGISGISHKKGAVTLAAIGYPTRDNAGSPETMTDWTGEWSYDYDGHNRLVNATPPNPVPEQMGGDYGYDWVGNRLSPPTGANMEYDAADRLIKWPGMYSYSYYVDGSLEEVRDAQGALVSSYTYHPDGLLCQATYMGDHTATNTWDASGNRVGLTINGRVCFFVYDPTAGIPAVIEEVVDGTPVYYYREPDGGLIARTDAVNSIRYYHFDALGSTRLLTDGDGDVTDKYAYDAWGTVVAHERYEGSIDQPYQYVGQYGYYTHYQDPEFKLLQLGVRFYDAETGRFISRDPIMKEYLSSYSYCLDCPTINIDPRGKLPLLVIGGIILIGEALIAKDAFDYGEKYRQCNQHFMAHCVASCRITRFGDNSFSRVDMFFPFGSMAKGEQGLIANLGGLLLEAWQATPWGKSIGDPERGWGNRYWLNAAYYNAIGSAIGTNPLFWGSCDEGCRQYGINQGLLIT